MNKTFKLNGVNVELSKKQLQNMLKKFDKKTIEFKIDENNGWDYCLRLYINGDLKDSMYFDKDDEPNVKTNKFNKLIICAIEEYGGKDNFATQKDLNDEDTKLWGIDLYNVCCGNEIYVYSAYNTYLKHQYNCFSKSIEPLKDIAKALERIVYYIKKAFRGE